MHSHDMTEPSESQAPVSGRRVIVPGVAVGHSVFHWTLQSFVVALPEIQQAFGLSSVGVGGILSAREFAAGLVALPGGVLVDIFRKYWGPLLALCLVCCSVGCFIIGVSPVYPLLLIGIAVVAISHSIWHLLAAASLSHHFPQRRGTVLSFHGVGGSVGDVAGPLVTGALLAFFTWQGILSVYAVVPLFLGATAIWALRNIGSMEEREEVAGSQRIEATRRLLSSPVLWGLTLVRGFRSMTLVALVTILPLYLDNDLEMSTTLRGFHIGLLIAVGLIAKPVAGMLSDRFGRKQVLAPGLAWSCLIALALLAFDSGVLLTVTIGLLGLFLYPDQPILTAAVFDELGDEVASTGLGITTFAGFIMAMFSPLIAGGLYETLGFQAVVYYIAALFAGAALVILVLPLRTTTSP